MILLKEHSQPKTTIINATLVLVQLLADQYVLSLQTLRCFWWLRRAEPEGMHSYLEWQFDKLTELMEEVTEKMEAKGYFQVKEVNDFLGLARLTDHLEDHWQPEELLTELLNGHRSLIETVSADMYFLVEEDETRKFLKAIKSQHTFMAWMLGIFLS